MKDFNDYPASKIAKLLGINMDDYADLVHHNFKEIKDEKGKVIEYQMRVSLNNNRKLLEKLDIDERYIIKFKVAEFDKVMK